MRLLELLTPFAGAQFGPRGGFLARRHLDIHDNAISSAGNRERGIAHVGGFLAKDRAQQPFLGRKFGFTFRSDLADENVARLDFRADADDAVVAQILERLFADVGDVARDFFGTELGITRATFKFLNVDRGEDVLAHEPLVDENRIFEIIAAPWDKRHEDIAAQGQFALICTRTIGKNLTLLDLLADFHNRPLVDAGAGVRAHELAQTVILIIFRRRFFRRHIAVFGNHDPAGGHIGHLAGRTGQHHAARVLRHTAFDARRHIRSFRTQ